jgi:hypothetical protein
MMKLANILRENEVPQMKHSVWYRTKLKYPAIIDSWEDLEQKMNQLNRIPGKKIVIRSTSFDDTKLPIFYDDDWAKEKNAFDYVDDNYFDAPYGREAIKVYVYNNNSGLAMIKFWALAVPYCFYRFMAFGNVPAEAKSVVDSLKGKAVFDSRSGDENSKWTANIEKKLDSLADRVEYVRNNDWQTWRNKQMKYFQMKKPRAQR